MLGTVPGRDVGEDFCFGPFHDLAQLVGAEVRQARVADCRGLTSLRRRAAVRMRISRPVARLVPYHPPRGCSRVMRTLASVPLTLTM